MLNTFQYACPETLTDALTLLRENRSKARLLAGGTDVIVRLRKGHIKPRIVIDLKHVQKLCAGIHEIEEGIRIGAKTVLSDIIEEQRVRRYLPALADAAATIGSVQVRNRATLAGNICNASPAADTAPALLVYGARVNIVGTQGKRSVPVNEFFLGPGQTVIQDDEIVESIDVPIHQEKVGVSFYKLTRRRGVDIATLTVCCLVKASGAALFAYGAVGPRPLLVVDDSGILVNPASSSPEKERVLQHLISFTSPISDVRASRKYRQEMVLEASRRTLSAALQQLHS